MRAVVTLLFLLVLTACLQAEISPPRKSSPPSRKGAEESAIEPLLADAKSAIVEGNSRKAARITAYLIFAGREISPAFLPKDFAGSLRILINELNTLSPTYAAKATKAALDFLALRVRLLREGFFSDGNLSSKVKGLDYASFIANNTVAFEWFPEDDRIASLRVQFILNSGTAVKTAEGWLKSENTALVLAGINLIGVAQLKNYGKAFEKQANDIKLSIELRIEYALAAERLGMEGLGVLRSFFLPSDIQLAYRLRSMEALAALGRKIASPLFIRIIVKESPDPVLLAAVIEMLTDWRESSLAPYVGRFLHSRDQKLVRVSIRAIGRIKIARLYPSVIKILSDSKDTAVQAEAIKCLASIGDKEYLPVVGAFIYNRVLAVRLEAALAIQALSQTDFGLSRNMDDEAQEVIIRRIRVWWQEHITEKQ